MKDTKKDRTMSTTMWPVSRIKKRGQSRAITIVVTDTLWISRMTIKHQ